MKKKPQEQYSRGLGQGPNVSGELAVEIAPPEGRDGSAPAGQTAPVVSDGADSSVTTSALPAALIFNPQIRLIGCVDETMLTSFREQFAQAQPGEGPIAIEVMTAGGNADTGRRLALEFRLARASQDRRLVFIGKTYVYSAGVTAMAGIPRDDRFLTRDAVVLIHCRQIERTVQISGPLRAACQRVQELLGELESGIAVEHAGFLELIAGTDITLEEISEKAAKGWYLSAEEAFKRRLIGGIL